MILVIDNYDSFVETLARYVREAGFEPRVARNDAMTTDDVAGLNPQAIILSPGPYTPSEAGICKDLPKVFPQTPMLGVCLGHLAIAEAYGGETIGAQTPVHGRSSRIHHGGEELFRGLPNPFEAGRYHALISSIDGTELQSHAHTEDGELMAFGHPERPHFGVQFHPESILTPHGRDLLANFLKLSQ